MNTCITSCNSNMEVTDFLFDVICLVYEMPDRKEDEVKSLFIYNQDNSCVSTVSSYKKSLRDLDNFKANIHNVPVIGTFENPTILNARSSNIIYKVKLWRDNNNELKYEIIDVNKIVEHHPV